MDKRYKLIEGVSTDRLGSTQEKLKLANLIYL